MFLGLRKFSGVSKGTMKDLEIQWMKSREVIQELIEEDCSTT